MDLSEKQRVKRDIYGNGIRWRNGYVLKSRVMVVATENWCNHCYVMFMHVEYSKTLLLDGVMCDIHGNSQLIDDNLSSRHWQSKLYNARADQKVLSLNDQYFKTMYTQNSIKTGRDVPFSYSGSGLNKRKKPFSLDADHPGHSGWNWHQWWMASAESHSAAQ